MRKLTRLAAAASVVAAATLTLSACGGDDSDDDTGGTAATGEAEEGGNGSGGDGDAPAETLSDEEAEGVWANYNMAEQETVTDPAQMAGLGMMVIHGGEVLFTYGAGLGCTGPLSEGTVTLENCMLEYGVGHTATLARDGNTLTATWDTGKEETFESQESAEMGDSEASALFDQMNTDIADTNESVGEFSEQELQQEREENGIPNYF